MDVSIGTIWEAVSRTLPDAVAVAEPGRETTYREFDERASRLAAALERAGVGEGDTVACYLYNGAAYLETVFAAFKLGAVPVNANYRYTGEELSELLADADAAALVFSGALADRVTHAAGHVPTLKLLVRAGDPPADGPAGPDVPELEDLLAAHAPRAPRSRPGSDRLFMYTGGTTGRPKGVVWRQSDLLHSLVVPIFHPLGVTDLPATLDEAVAIATEAHHGGRAPITMPVVPLMHATGLFNTMGALMTGGRAVTARPGVSTRNTSGARSPSSGSTPSSSRATPCADRSSTNSSVRNRPGRRTTCAPCAGSSAPAPLSAIRSRWHCTNVPTSRSSTPSRRAKGALSPSRSPRRYEICRPASSPYPRHA